MSESILTLSLEDKLFRTKYEPDAEHSHITVNPEICAACETKPCTFMCPAGVYRIDPNNNAIVTVSHENCLECGTCIQICHPGSVDWSVPDGGMGVKYRFG